MFTTLTDVTTLSVSDDSWGVVPRFGASSHVRIQADKAFHFCQGDTSNGGFIAEADTPYIIELAGLSVYAPSGGGTVTFKLQGVKVG